MKTAELHQKFLDTWNAKYPDDGLPDKINFHKLAKKVCKQIASDLELAKETFRVNTNMAGDACGGETTLHTDSFYLQFCTPECLTPDTGYRSELEILYRSCKGHKEYSNHGANNWTTYAKAFQDYPKFLAQLTLTATPK